MSIFSRSLIALATIVTAVLPATAEDTIATLRLDDGLSFVSFQDEQVFPFASSATIVFRFGEPTASGVIPFTIQPGDVSIPPIPIGPNEELIYSLASPTSGTVQASQNGERRMSFTASVRATLVAPGGGGTYTYSLPFTTESVAATNTAGTESVQVTGMRLIDSVWHVQLVGATVNRDNAFPKPGTAVYTVLSGRFDQMP
jgi:hypothetical protein